MKTLTIKTFWIRTLVGFLVTCSFGCAQSAAPDSPLQNAAPEERMFFPRDMLWGWAQLDLAPPHNEIDPNLCAGNAGQYGGANAARSARRAAAGTWTPWPGSWCSARRLSCSARPFRRHFILGRRMPSALSTPGEREFTSGKDLSSG